MDKNLLEKAMQQALDILRGNLGIFTEKFPKPVTENGIYPTGINTDWTTGFCTGQYWLAYEISGEECFRKAAQVQVNSFAHRLKIRENIDHHDMGFLYTPSCTAAYKLTGDTIGHDTALAAADNLMTRFQEKGQFFQAWGELGAKNNYRLIIDCLLNLPLLYWATEQTQNPKYREKAVAHTQTAVENLVREDYSTYHTYFMSPETGLPEKGVTAQGYKNDSAWARGQAWGIYGMALAYRYTQNPKCLELFHHVTDFFLKHLPESGVPYWDLAFDDQSNEPWDSSASAIAVCGIYEMLPMLDEQQAQKYQIAAEKMLEALIIRCAVEKPDKGAGLLNHGVYCKSSPFNTVKDYGVDECNLWGDYFYLEALVRASRKWNAYW